MFHRLHTRDMFSQRSSAFALISLAFLAHALSLSAAQGWRMVDDAYISFRYLDHFLAGHGLVFNLGERVEGYSNFLWIMVLALPSTLGIPTPLAALVLGLVSGLVTLWLSLRLTERLTGATWLGLCVAGILALDGSFARWSVEGLETLFFTALITGAVLSELDIAHHTRQSLWPSRPGLLLGLASLTRPEGLLFVGLLVLYRLINALGKTLKRHEELGPVGQTYEVRSRSLGDPLFWSSLASFIVSALLLILPHLLWRHSYYGEWVPNTAFLKVQPGFVSTIRGIRYAVMFLVYRAPLVLLLLGLVAWRAFPSHARVSSKPPAQDMAQSPLHLLLFFSAGIVAYLTLTGGDWMGWGRFFMPLAPALSLLWSEKCVRLYQQTPAGLGYPRHPAPLALIIAAALLSHLTSSWLEERPRLLRAHEEHRERLAVIEWLGEHASPSSRLLTEEIGEIPYETKLYTLDVYGLIDKHIAKNGIYDPDSAPGHQKTDLQYSLAQQPDFLVMADFHSTWARNVDPSHSQVRYPLLRNYIPVPVALPTGRLEIYRRQAHVSPLPTGKDSADAPSAAPD